MSRYTHVFFIGIGGIGMSALARYFNERGVTVSGYDKTETQLTKTLVREGIDIHYKDDVYLIPEDIDLVVYTPAIPKEHKQLYKLKAQDKVPVLKRSELLGQLSEESDAIAIAGTHGKTTTSAITAHILRYCGEDISAFIGGILSDYETNYFSGQSSWVVLEADEYDRSFLTLSPEISVLQSMDADHLDIYENDGNIKEAFIQFLNKTVFGGKIILNEKVLRQLSDTDLIELKRHNTVISYGFGEDADARLLSPAIDDGMTTYQLEYSGQRVEVRQRMPGDHNRLNSAAALLAAHLVGLDLETASKSLRVFKGIKRRFEFVVQRDVVYIDDYAHHPTELNAVIKAVRELYPGKRVTGIFQPHLYSRTRDFADGFADALDKLDQVILMEIYPAREEPIKGVNTAMIKSKMKNEKVDIMDSDAIIETVKNKEFDILLTLGAGDIDQLVPQIKAVLT